MNNSSSGDRLDRLEAFIERFAQESDKQIKSNAKAIEALSDQQRENEQRATLDRRRLSEAMSRLAGAQADFYSAQAGFYSAQTETYRAQDAQDELIQTLSRRQGEIVEILKRLTGGSSEAGA